MPYYYPSLELGSRPNADGTAGALPQLPPGLPAVLEEASLTMNHALLLGELLGVPIHEAQAIIDDVFELPDIVPHLLLPEDCAILLRTFSACLNAIRPSVDEDGRPRQDGGALLAASEFLCQDAEGRLIIRSGGVPVRELIVRLDQLCHFLDFAARNDLHVIVHDEGFRQILGEFDK